MTPRALITAVNRARKAGRLVLLDVCCKAGGAAMGYHRAGFDVVGCDVEPQPRFPFTFVQADAFDVLENWGAIFDAIHASPPCQRFCQLMAVHPRETVESHRDLIAPMRAALQRTGRPWAMENVPGAPLLNAAQLCGSAFGLDVRRHRRFESSELLFGVQCDHRSQAPRFRTLDGRRVGKSLARVVGVHGHLNYPGERELRERAMGIDWMTTAELSQAIPPAYTEWIGRQLALSARARAVA